MAQFASTPDGINLSLTFHLRWPECECCVCYVGIARNVVSEHLLFLRSYSGGNVLDNVASLKKLRHHNSLTIGRDWCWGFMEHHFEDLQLVRCVCRFFWREQQRFLRCNGRNRERANTKPSWFSLCLSDQMCEMMMTTMSFLQCDQPSIFSHVPKCHHCAWLGDIAKRWICVNTLDLKLLQKWKNSVFLNRNTFVIPNPNTHTHSSFHPDTYQFANFAFHVLIFLRLRIIQSGNESFVQQGDTAIINNWKGIN